MNRDTIIRDPYLNQTINEKYKINRQIGKGGFCVIYEGEIISDRSANPNFIAVKFVRTDVSDDTRNEIKRRVNNEAELLKKLNHPNIVRYVAHGEDAKTGSPFICMELFRGESLEFFLKRSGKGLELAQALQTMLM